MRFDPIPIGFYPFWFWNDTLPADEIRWQIKEMADKGVRGFFIHPRQGLGQPYLSKSFFEMVDVALEAAEEHGLLVHLYDEYPYPSGIAGGEVVLGSPQYYATRLVQKSYALDGGTVRLELPQGKVLSCIAYPLEDGAVDWEHGVDLRDHVGVVLTTDSYLETGLTAYNQKRYFASEPTPVLVATLREGWHKLFVSVQAVVNHFKYWDHYVDVLNREAVERFIALTHERYRKRYGDKFGTTIISIFTDETEPRWSDGVPEAFMAEYGYDLVDVLPALQSADHPDHVQVSYDLYRLLYKMFCRSYDEPIAEWCRQHGIAYSGEKPSLRLSQLRYMDIPGCEPGHTKVGARLDLLQARIRGNAKATASAAYFYGKPRALCECYHSIGWSATLQDAKFIAEGLLLMGIAYLVPHGFFYSTHALTKHDAPPTFFFQMPFWPLFGALAERVDRIRQLFEGTYIDTEVLVVDHASGIPTDDDLAAYEAILWLLMESHLDFHIVDTDILQEGQIEEGRIRVADVAAKVVVVPPMRVIEDPLRQWLARYEAAGGAVVYCGQDFEAEALKAELLGIVQPSLGVWVDGREVGDILVVKRVGEDRMLWFALNTSDETITAEISSGGELREIPLNDDLPQTLKVSETFRVSPRYLRTVHPFESFVLEAAHDPRCGRSPNTCCGRSTNTCCGRSPTEPPRATSCDQSREWRPNRPHADDSALATEPLPQIIVPIRGPAKLRLENDNLLRMHHWRMSLREEDGVYGPSAVVPAVPLANQLEHGRFRFAPRFNKHFGHPPELAFPKLHIRYEYAFECQYSDPVQLVMEPGSIVGEWRIYVNGAGPLRLADFAPTTSHVRDSLGTDITDFLVQGENTVRVEVVTDRSDGGLLNPLYLAGDFGVALNPTRLLPRADVGGFERYEDNLLPYYAGVIEYTTDFVLDRVPDADHVLLAFDYGVPFHEATEVSINGGEYKPMLWHPRCVRLRTDQLQVGENTLKTRVYTTLIRSFEGQWFDYERHEYREVGS